MLDALTRAAIDKSKPLRIGETSRPCKCCLCGGLIVERGEDATAWVVTIKGYGKAHPHCAVDYGWTVT